MRPGLFGVSRRWPKKRTRGNDGTSLREQRNFYCLPFNSSALYYHQTPTWRYGHASTPTKSPPITGKRNMQLPPSLEWHVCSSSSGNNCHAVHRSLSSGASLCDGTVGFLPCPILSAKLYFTYWLEHLASKLHDRLCKTNLRGHRGPSDGKMCLGLGVVKQTLIRSTRTCYLINGWIDEVKSMFYFSQDQFFCKQLFNMQHDNSDK